MRFGEVLRRERRAASKTLGDVSRLLGVSVVYLSDIERGNRRPLHTERILKVAEFLGTDAGSLIRAAQVERGVIEYNISNARPIEADVVGGLVSGLARGGVTDAQLEGIQRILKTKGSTSNDE